MLQAIKEKAYPHPATQNLDYADYTYINSILVFKTNINRKKDVRRIAPILNEFIGITNWNVATDDIDKVLRIQTQVLEAQDIIRLLNQAGYFCQELPD